MRKILERPQTIAQCSFPTVWAHTVQQKTMFTRLMRLPSMIYSHLKAYCIVPRIAQVGFVDWNSRSPAYSLSQQAPHIQPL